MFSLCISSGVVEVFENPGPEFPYRLPEQEACRRLLAFDQLLAALEARQWSNAGHCPECDRHRKRGHYDYCSLGRAIARAKAP